jgi:tripartite-type tricarboxylate transporter receptor subunit TctC
MLSNVDRAALGESGKTMPAAREAVTSAFRLSTFALLLVIAAPALAQQPYPSKTVRIVSPFPPGGGNDALCRIVAPKLSEQLKQQVIVDNRGGANGIVGTEVAARSAPDGYTIVLVPSGHAVNASLYKKLPFDSIRDFTPITLVGSSPLVLAVHPSLPVKNIKDLIALARARPGQLTYVSAGVGASGHLGGAMFDVLAGTKMLHIPYKGMALAIVDLMSGQVTMTFGTSASVIPHARAGRLRALATTGANRSTALPELPTIAESGVPGYEASLWYGFVGPARIPPDVLGRLHSALYAVLQMPDVRERLASQGVEAQPNTPEEFSKLLAADVGRWAKVVQKTGITAD